MNAARSYPPCLNPELATELAALRDLAVLADLLRAKRATVTVTTVVHIELARTTVMPALEHAARVGIARVQEASGEERFR